MNNKTSADMDVIFDMIRYQYVDITIMSMAVRECTCFRASQKFKNIIKTELYRRLKKTKSIFECNNRNKTEFDKNTLMKIEKFKGEKIKDLLSDYTDKPRKFYSKVISKHKIEKHDLSTDIIDGTINNNFYNERKKEVGKVFFVKLI